MYKMRKLLLILSILSSISFPQEIIEVIKPINLISGEVKSFLISDLFYSENYDRIIFNPDSTLKVTYESDNGFTDITSFKSSEGYGTLPFNFYDETYYILYKTEFRQTIFFSYQPHKAVEKVNLIGSFNGWNRENLPMNDEDGDGIYSTGIPLEPGRYEYKFFVNGEESIDSLNSETIPNGLGGSNSVLNVRSLYTGKSYLHKLDCSYKESKVNLSFFYESEINNEIEVIALLDNELISQNSICVEAGKILIDIPLEKLNGEKTLRIAVNENGRASNLQTIMLNDGNPLTNRDSTWYDAIIYSIMIDRFSDGDRTNSIPVEHPELLKPANYHGGDLQGIINKLDDGYFNSLGINTLWISPLIDNTPNAYKEYPEPHRYYTGYHGYWPVHPTKVEERFGDMELLKRMISIAHSKGIKVLLDYVANHIHIEHPFWKEHRDWFGVLELPDGSRNLRRWDEYRLTTWFEPFMPKFDYEGSEEALEVMTDNAVWWLKETGADGFRHDAVKHVPNGFWRLLTKKIKKELQIPQEKIYYQIGETFGSYDLVSSYVNNGQLDAQFNFILYDTAIPTFTDSSSSFTALDQQMQKTFDVYGVNHLMGNVMDSHDKVRFMSYADGDISLSDGNAEEIGWVNPPEVDDSESYNILKLYLAFVFTIPGIPVIYYGDEIGMTGAGDPDNRRMMRFGDDVVDEEQQVFNDVKKIVNLRNRHSSLRYGDFQTLFVNENCYAYLRSDFNERVLVVLNKSKNEEIVEITLPEIYKPETARDVLSDKEFEIQNNLLSINLNGMAYCILKLE
jgi:glycosidase